MIVPARAYGFLVVGGIGIIGGGLVAAVADPLHLTRGAWAVAYLVLVVGVAQIGLGVLQERLAARPVSARLRTGQLVTWNVGNAAVLGGTLAAAPFVVDAGGLLLVVALALFLVSQRAVGPGNSGPAPLPSHGRSRGHRSAVWVFRGLVILLLVSIPVGLILAHLHG